MLEQRRRIDRAGRDDDLAAGSRDVRRAAREYSTPTALRPSKTSLVANAPVTTVRFGRRIAGLRNAVAADSRNPPRVVIW